MKKILALFCAAFLILSGSFAQNDNNSEDSGQKIINYSQNEVGDQFINIGLMVTFPLNFGGDFPLYRKGQLATGGAGTLGYHRFLTPCFAVGVDVSFGYHPTIQNNMFTYVPLVLCATYQPTWRKFEFPITLGIGAAVESHINSTYFPGFILKPQAGIYYRVTPSWSFGMKGDFMYMPQWYSNSEYNDYGIFASCFIGARYHF